MRKLIVSEFVTLDGVIEDPGWNFQFGSEEQEEFKFAELDATSALLLRRWIGLFATRNRRAGGGG